MHPDSGVVLFNLQMGGDRLYFPLTCQPLFSLFYATQKKQEWFVYNSMDYVVKGQGPFSFASTNAIIELWQDL